MRGRFWTLGQEMVGSLCSDVTDTTPGTKLTLLWSVIRSCRRTHQSFVAACLMSRTDMMSPSGIHHLLGTRIWTRLGDFGRPNSFRMRQASELTVWPMCTSVSCGWQ